MYYVLMAANPFSEATQPIVALLNSALSPLLALVGVVGAIYCVFLGLKLAKAEEPQDREKAKGALKNAIVGFLLIFILMAALKIMLPSMEKWVNSVSPTTTTSTNSK